MSTSKLSYAKQVYVCLCSQKSEKKSSSNDSERAASALFAACRTCCSDALLICSITLVAACFSAPIISWCRVRLTSTLDLASGLQGKNIWSHLNPFSINVVLVWVGIWNPDVGIDMNEWNYLISHYVCLIGLTTSSQPPSLSRPYSDQRLK